MSRYCFSSTISSCKYKCCSYLTTCPSCLSGCSTFTSGYFTPSSTSYKCTTSTSTSTSTVTTSSTTSEFSTTALINVIVWGVLCVLFIVFCVIRKLRAANEAEPQVQDFNQHDQYNNSNVNVQIPQQPYSNPSYPNAYPDPNPAYPSPAYPSPAYPNPAYPNAYPNPAYPNAYPNAAYPGPNAAYPPGYYDPNMMNPAPAPAPMPGYSTPMAYPGGMAQPGANYPGGGYPAANPIIIVKQ